MKKLAKLSDNYLKNTPLRRLLILSNVLLKKYATLQIDCAKFEIHIHVPLLLVSSASIGCMYMYLLLTTELKPELPGITALSNCFEYQG